MIDQHTDLLKDEPAGYILKQLTVRALEQDEYARAGEFFDNEHYLGDLRSVWPEIFKVLTTR